MLENSQPVSFSEEEAKAYLENDTVEVYVDLQQGNGIGKAWGCDLTYDYVKINASYRT
jgi:glutamate N-acetyltransferase/amino-acid N-acetyltransferase